MSSFFQIPSDEVFEQPEEDDEDFKDSNEIIAARSERRRAKSINPLAMSQDRRQIELAVKNVTKKKTNQLIPTVFRYNLKNGNGSEASESISTVYIAGTMTGWRSKQMVALKDESNFLAIIDCLPGQ